MHIVTMTATVTQAENGVVDRRPQRAVDVATPVLGYRAEHGGDVSVLHLTHAFSISETIDRRVDRRPGVEQQFGDLGAADHRVDRCVCGSCERPQ